jgi:membrane-associated phospholipid phosphatase
MKKIESNLMDVDDLNNVIDKDQQRSIFIPLELNNSELITLAAATSLGIVAFKNDQEISDTIKRNNSNVAKSVSSVGNLYGSVGFGIVAAGSYFLGVHYENDKLKSAGLFIVSAEISQVIVTEAIKNSFSRVRPSGGVGPYEFFQTGNKSFWSGHTSTAFALSTVISEMYKDDYPVVPYIAYGVAALTAYARVHDNQHWASDVILGAVAGHLIAKLSLSGMNHDGERGGLTFYPTIDPISKTFYANFEWTPKVHNKTLKCSKLPDGEAKIRACIEEALKK